MFDRSDEWAEQDGEKRETKRKETSSEKNHSLGGYISESSNDNGITYMYMYVCIVHTY